MANKKLQPNKMVWHFMPFAEILINQVDANIVFVPRLMVLSDSGKFDMCHASAADSKALFFKNVIYCNLPFL